MLYKQESFQHKQTNNTYINKLTYVYRIRKYTDALMHTDRDNKKKQRFEYVLCNGYIEAEKTHI